MRRPPARNNPSPVTSSGDVDSARVAATTPEGSDHPDRLATPRLRPDTRFNRQRRYRGNGVAPCNACSGGRRPGGRPRHRASRPVSSRMSIKSGERKTLRLPHRRRRNGVIR